MTKRTGHTGTEVQNSFSTLMERTMQFAGRMIAIPLIVAKDFAVGMASAAVLMLIEAPLRVTAKFCGIMARPASAVGEAHDGLIGLVRNRDVAILGATATGTIALLGAVMIAAGALSPKRTFNSAADCPPAQVAAAQATVARCVAPQPSVGPR